MFGCLEYLYITACYTTTTCQLYELHAYKRVVFSFHTRIITRVEKHYEKPEYSFVNGRFRVKTTEVRRVYVHSSLLVVTSNQNASNKKQNRLNIYPKPGMSHYIPLYDS